MLRWPVSLGSPSEAESPAPEQMPLKSLSLHKESDPPAVGFLAASSGSLKIKNSSWRPFQERRTEGLEVWRCPQSHATVLMSALRCAFHQAEKSLSTNIYSYIEHLAGLTRFPRAARLKNETGEANSDSSGSKFHALSYCRFSKTTCKMLGRGHWVTGIKERT